MINININKAKEITKERLRAERAPKFAELDIEFMRNISNPEKLLEIEERKQILRDVTKLVDNATTLEDLKSLKVE